MAISNETPNGCSLEQSQSLSRLRLESVPQSQNHRHPSSLSSPNRLFPLLHPKRPHHVAFGPLTCSSSSAAARTDLYRADTRSGFSEIPLKKTNETGKCKAKSRGQDTNQGHGAAGNGEAGNNASLGPESCASGKHYRKPKVARYRKYGTQGSNADPPDSLDAASGGRYDSSLGLLTKKFISLIREAKDGTLDLNKTVDILAVQKRRIYDITNVLEGIGLIEKTTKNNIRWKGSEMLAPREEDDQITTLKAEVENLYAEEYRLDDCIREKQDLLRTLEYDENCKKYLFLTKEDITSLPCFKNHTLIAIKAPRASSVEVPDPDDEFSFPHRLFRLIVRSTMGPIDLYLLRKHGGQEDDVTVKQASSRDSHADTTNPSFDHQNNMGMLSDNTFCSEGPKVSGIQKIVPSDFGIDADYWFRSDHEVSTTELWGLK